MEYFLVRQDKRIENAMDIPLIERKPEHQALALPFSQDRRFLDYMEGKGLLVSEGLKKVLEKYNNKLTWYVYALVDPQKQEQRVYFYTDQVPEAACISSQTEYNQRKQVKRLVLEQENMGGCPYMYARTQKEWFLIFRQDVAESILRRNFYGIWLERLEVVSEGMQQEKKVI